MAYQSNLQNITNHLDRNCKNNDDKLAYLRKQIMSLADIADREKDEFDKKQYIIDIGILNRKFFYTLLQKGYVKLEVYYQHSMQAIKEKFEAKYEWSRGIKPERDAQKELIALRQAYDIIDCFRIKPNIGH